MVKNSISKNHQRRKTLDNNILQNNKSIGINNNTASYASLKSNSKPSSEVVSLTKEAADVIQEGAQHMDLDMIIKDFIKSGTPPEQKEQTKPSSLKQAPIPETNKPLVD